MFLFPNPCYLALELVRKDTWELQGKKYNPGTAMVPHKFQIGYPVLVRLPRSGNLEPRWKGPYLVLLTSSPLGQPCSQLPSMAQEPPPSLLPLVRDSLVSFKGLLRLSMLQILKL